MSSTFPLLRPLNVLCLIKINIFSDSVGLTAKENPVRWDDVSGHVVIIKRIRIQELGMRWGTSYLQVNGPSVAYLIAT